MIPVKRFIVWMDLTFMTDLVICMEVPTTFLGSALIGIAVGILWEIALRYIEEPNDWN